ncbi:hypothetical protein NDU88_003374 [Pleurodeles waltl]|uniref:Uncharacterized protein n=1 Tax=Pleurodeles waltl TaxID=8319 RepID=A0AAV7LIC8_PLEWA|nr:hypothetical protein NDU88_003374 [Pleurodeles waltl]
MLIKINTFGTLRRTWRAVWAVVVELRCGERAAPSLWARAAVEIRSDREATFRIPFQGGRKSSSGKGSTGGAGSFDKGEEGRSELQRQGNSLSPAFSIVVQLETLAGQNGSESFVMYGSRGVRPNKREGEVNAIRKPVLTYSLRSSRKTTGSKGNLGPGGLEYLSELNKAQKDQARVSSRGSRGRDKSSSKTGSVWYKSLKITPSLKTYFRVLSCSLSMEERDSAQQTTHMEKGAPGVGMSRGDRQIIQIECSPNRFQPLDYMEDMEVREKETGGSRLSQQTSLDSLPSGGSSIEGQNLEMDKMDKGLGLEGGPAAADSRLLN